MTNYGTEKYIIIPSNDKLFDRSLESAKNKFNRLARNFWFYFQKKRKQVGAKRQRWSRDNVYYILLNCKYNGYKVIIYPSKLNTLTQDDLKNKLSIFIELGLIKAILQDGSILSIENAVKEHNISIVNSILITDEKEFSDKLFAKYYPNNDYKIDDAKRTGFNLKLWDESFKSAENYFTENDTKDSLYQILDNDFQINRKIYSLQSADFVRNQVIYIGCDNDEKTTRYIESNYKLIKQKFEEKNLTFIYFPFFKNNTDELINALLPSIEYVFPQFTGKNLDVVIDFFKSMTPNQYYDFIINSLQLPEFTKPSIIKNLYTVYGAEENSFYYLPLDNSIETELIAYAEKTVKPNSKEFPHLQKESSRAEKKAKPKYDADDKFEEEA